MTTLRASLRARWVKTRGAVACDERAAHPAREAHPLAVDVGAGAAEDLDRLGVVDDLDADLLEEGVGVVLDLLEALGRDDLDRRELAGEVGKGLDRPREAGSLACLAAASRLSLLGDVRGHGHTIPRRLPRVTTAAPPLLVIAGATATGKTGLAIDIARALLDEGRHVVVISADSRQVYRGLDIGTAKATVADRRDVPHAGLDLVDPPERFTVTDFVHHATGVLTDVAAAEPRGLAILVGGSPGCTCAPSPRASPSTTCRPIRPCGPRSRRIWNGTGSRRWRAGSWPWHRSWPRPSTWPTRAASSGP